MSSDGTNIEVVKAFDPTAVLIVKLCSAENLAKKRGLSGGLRSLVGQNLPDPYAKIRLYLILMLNVYLTMLGIKFHFSAWIWRFELEVQNYRITLGCDEP